MWLPGAHSLVIKFMASEGQRTLCFGKEFIIKTTLGARQSIEFRETGASFTVRMRSKVPRKPGVSSITLAIVTACGCALPAVVDQLHSVANG